VNFLNIGPGEMMAILAIAILVIGPARMVTFARTIGRVLRRMRSISGEFLGSLQEELSETEEETRAAIGSLQEGLSETQEDARTAIGGFQEAGDDVATEVDTTKQETDETLEGAAESALGSTTSMQEELTSFAREAHQALKEVSDSFTGLIKAEAEKPDTEDTDDDKEI
jgi:Sec-independent protein translocase protein TatA